MHAMRNIGLKLTLYHLDHPATEADELTNKSIDDFVAMNVLTPADAAYIREHQIKFYGYDPNHIAGDVPLLEAVYSRGDTRQRIICYSNFQVANFPLERTR